MLSQSGNSWYLYLIPVVLGGFALCGLGTVPRVVH